MIESPASGSQPPPHFPTSSTAPSGSSPPLSRDRLPPRNFISSHAAARTAARSMREPKTPFVPRRKIKGAFAVGLDGTSTTSSPGVGSNYVVKGKGKDLEGCSLEELADMWERNLKILSNPELSNLGNGDGRVKVRQQLIEDRIQELAEMTRLRARLMETHLNEPGSESVSESQDSEMIKSESPDVLHGRGELRETVKQEEEEQKELSNEMVTPLEPTLNSELIGTSPPTTKKRLTERLFLNDKNKPSLTYTMPLTESLALQRVAVSRDQEAAAKRARQLEMDSRRPKRVGALLKGALVQSGGMSDFMFHTESDDEDSGAPDTLGYDQVDEDEDGQLNPYRTAFESGYERAIEAESHP